MTTGLTGKGRDRGRRKRYNKIHKGERERWQRKRKQKGGREEQAAWEQQKLRQYIWSEGRSLTNISLAFMREAGSLLVLCCRVSMSWTQADWGSTKLLTRLSVSQLLVNLHSNTNRCRSDITAVGICPCCYERDI